MHGFVSDFRLDQLHVTGPAAERFLDRMLSNKIADLSDDSARGVFLLAATGRIVSGGMLLREGNGFVVACAAGWGEPLKSGLEKYRVADPVEFELATGTGGVWFGLDAHPQQAAGWPEETLGVGRHDDVCVVRTDWAEGGAALWLGDLPADEPTVDMATWTRARVAAGMPWFDAELTEKTIPLEAGLFSWLSHTKGCYVGQEVVERMWSRDRAARRLVRFYGAGVGAAQMLPLPVRGDGGKGTITSVASAEEGLVGLGYYAGDMHGTAEDETGRTWTIQVLEAR